MIGLILFIFVHLILPIYLMVKLIKSREETKIDLIILYFWSLGFSIYLYIAGRWDIFSYYLRFIIPTALIISILISFRKFFKKALIKKFNLKKVVYYFLNLVFLSILYTVITVTLINYNKIPSEKVSLTFPLKKGSYYIAHGGNNFLLNYHQVSKTQMYALDIVKLNKLGRRVKNLELFPNNLRDYGIFSDSVFSPCNGIVIKVFDGLLDVNPSLSYIDSVNPAGNYVIIRCNTNIKVILAHLKQGSIKVSENDTVKIGDLIGLVGNSGNTSEPHLHIHAVCEDSTPVGMIFDGKFLKRNDIINSF